MTTAIFTHPACLGHDSGPGHPEGGARLQAVLDGLATLDRPDVVFREAPEAGVDAIARAHDADYVAHVLASVPATGYAPLDHETALGPGSGEALLRAVGAGIAAVDAVLVGEVDSAFCAIRPCGHHAEPDRAMGFCIFNTVAIAALHARAVHGIDRIAVLDFDVHHGNGTEAILRGRDHMFYASSHEYPLYPGTGTRSENGPCRIVNVPLAPMSAGPQFRDAWSWVILPRLRTFGPDLILVSTGFDAHRKDPLSTLQLEIADFVWLTKEIKAAAEESCGGRIVSVLEGGYDLDVLSSCARAHVEALADP